MVHIFKNWDEANTGYFCCAVEYKKSAFCNDAYLEAEAFVLFFVWYSVLFYMLET